MLKVALFGEVRLTHDDWQNEIILTRDLQALLAYLLLQRNKIHFREMLADLFWGEHGQEKARGSLNTALWKLKRALEPDGIPTGTYLKNSYQGGVAFNRESSYWLDVEIFEKDMRQILACPFQTADETHINTLERTLGLYRGELLEGVYKDWALRERDRLRAVHLKGLIYLLQYHGFHGAYETAITFGHQILELDPLREEIHREVMRLYMDNGQRAQAIRQYEICRATLAEQLNVEPMEDTKALNTQIICQRTRSTSDLILDQKIGIDQAVRQLMEATEAIDKAKEQIQQAFQLIAQFSNHPEEMLIGQVGQVHDHIYNTTPAVGAGKHKKMINQSSRL
jgi:DNA-binding SARP family transcriptional activator